MGVIIITPERETLKYGVQLTFLATNNEAEYKGVLTRLKVGKALGVKNLLLQSDSKLIVGQIKGEFEANEEIMQKYVKNIEAEELAKQVSSKAGPTNIDLKIEVQKCPSTEEVLTFAIQNESNWMTPILSFL